MLESQVEFTTTWNEVEAMLTEIVDRAGDRDR